MKLFMKCLTMSVALVISVAATASAADITGAGATFPYPLYAKWAEAYKSETGIGLNYQSIGSGGGINQIKAGTVNFGASDMPLEPSELESAGLVQFPTVIGGVIPIVNLEGIKPGEIKLDGQVLADIFRGKITKWNDPQITKLNAGVKLPDLDISVVHRADGSGTTFIFTNYLSKVSPEWKSEVGTGVSVSWPAGVGGKGNEGVASNVQRISGSIGYVEYAYVIQNKMTSTMLKNHDGQFVTPGASNFQSAAAGADWAKAPGFYMILTDQPGEGSWPISGATFILMHKVQQDPESAKRVLAFFSWAYDKGGKLAEELSYIPMPVSVVNLIRSEWKSGIKGPDDKPIY